MELLFLGTGTTAITSNRSSSAYVLSGENFKILVDMGPGTLLRLQQIGINPKNIPVILISHFHEDHLADLWPYIFTKIYDPFDNTVRTKVFAHSDLKNHIHILENSMKPWLSKMKNLEITAAEQSKVYHLGNLTIQTFKMEHREESLGYLIKSKNRAVGFSGDTDLCDGLIELCEESDVVVLECSSPSSFPIKGHLTPEKIEKLIVQYLHPSRIPQKIFLSHIYPYPELQKEMEKLKTHYSQIHIAFDGQKIKL